jgi:16S rRNA (cytosine1402-N4)-methyltransferase
MTYEHIPVLLKEVIFYLKPGSGENFVDATLGGGGYTKAILERIQPSGKVLAIDLDKDALKNAELGMKNAELGKNLVLHHGNFQNINKITKEHEFNNISGVVADLGLSSYELDQSARGFSFQKKEPLDMRFDQSQSEDAKFILNNRSEQELVKIFNDYGEEKFSRQIARKILECRMQNAELRHTNELYQIIQEALPKPVKHKADDSARRIFQALRIAVNYELSALEEFLPKAFDLLNPGGRLVIVSFHSLEDRIVKQYFNSLSKGCVCPIDFPQCVCGKNPQGKVLTKKIVIASPEELETNIRSKPAKLRAIVKL